MEVATGGMIEVTKDEAGGVNDLDVLPVGDATDGEAVEGRAVRHSFEAERPGDGDLLPVQFDEADRLVDSHVLVVGAAEDGDDVAGGGLVDLGLNGGAGEHREGFSFDHTCDGS